MNVCASFSGAPLEWEWPVLWFCLGWSLPSVPAKAPSGGNTGYPSEKCYWTKDGKIKTEPTYVLLNIYKNSSEPTFCPDCGRLVVSHNPAPVAGRSAPPTKGEYQKRR